MRRDLHADRFGATAGGHDDGRLLGQSLQALQRVGAARFGGDRQSAIAVGVAQQHDAAAAQLRQGPLHGGQGGRGWRLDMAYGHAFLFNMGGLTFDIWAS